MAQVSGVVSIPAAQVYFPQQDLDALAPRLVEILRTGRLTLGPYTQKFEEEFSRIHGKKGAVAVNSGTSALEIIFRGMGITGGDVIVPVNTFAATAFAAIHAGNRLVLADIDRNLCLDPEDLERRITRRTKAVVVVHIGGRIVPEVEQIADICEKKGIPLIEDAAHAHGSSFGGRIAGAFGVAAAFSFYPTKVITSGEGGMILTDDEEIVAKARIFRDQGKAGFNQNLHTELGYNWRMSEIHACIGLSQLARLDQFIDARRKIAAIYDRGLGDLDAMEVLRDEEGMRSNYYKYLVTLSPSLDRTKLKSELKERHGVSLSGEVYDTPLHEQPVFRGMGSWPPGSFPRAEDLCRRHICLPVFASMTRDQAEYVVESIHKVLP